MPAKTTVLEIEGRDVVITNPDKVFFPRTGHTKLDLVNYYLAVADGAVRGVAGRPMAMKRFVNGAESTPFFQKRAPDSRPEWIETVDLELPVGADRQRDRRARRGATRLGHQPGLHRSEPAPVRADDVDRPDELRVDLDPIRGVPWPHVRDVAMVTQAGPGGLRSGRLAEDVRLARLPRLLSDRAPLDVPRGPPGGRRTGARSGAARTGPGHQQVVEGGAARRLCRLQPERQRPYDRFGLLGAPQP